MIKSSTAGRQYCFFGQVWNPAENFFFDLHKIFTAGW